MSIALTAFPPTLSFSGDRIAAEFTCTNIFSQAAVKAVNMLQLPDPVPYGYSVDLQYGGKTVTMEASDMDDSGTKLFSTENIAVLPEVQRQCFQDNYQLSNDFIITNDGSKIMFTAKLPGTSYNMVLFNTTPGTVEKLKHNYGVKFRLYLENIEHTGFELISETFLNVQLGETNLVEALIGDKLHTQIGDDIRKLLPEIPYFGTGECKVSCRKYYFEYAEAFNDQVQKVHTSEIKTVIHGKFSALGEATKNIGSELYPTNGITRFLKQGSKEIKTRKDQPQYLYFVNTRASFVGSLKIKYYFTNGTVASITKYVQEFKELRKVAFDVRFDKLFVPGDYPVLQVKKYEVCILNAQSEPVSESLFYVLDYAYRPFIRYFFNWSSWGSMDTRMFYGKGSHELNLVQSIAEKGYYKPSEIQKGSSFVYNISSTTTFTSTTGFLKDKYELLYNRDFYLSPLKYCLSKNSLLPIVVTSKTIQEVKDGDNLFAQQFEWEYLFEDHAFTEGDVSPAIVAEPIPIGMIHFGSMAKTPTTENEIFALGNTLPSETYGFPFYTGLDNVFIIALPPGKTLGSAYDQTSNEDVTLSFSKSNMQVNDLNYTICVMRNGKAYSISHTLIISIINV